MAGQPADVGTGATLTCGTTGFTGLVHLEDIRWDAIVRSAIPTSHLGTPAPAAGHRGNATFLPGRVVVPGLLALEIQHHPQVRPPLHEPPELITLTFPKAPNDASPAVWSCMGFFVDAESLAPFDGKMMSVVILKLTGEIAMTAAVGIGEETPGEVPCTPVPLLLAGGLTVCLDCAELLDTRFDAVGTTDMASLNGVTGVAGLGSLAAHFVADAFQSLSTFSADTTIIGPFTLAFWVKPGVFPIAYSAQALLSQGNTTSVGQYEWLVLLLDDGHLRVSVGGGGAGVIASSTAILAPGGSYFVLAWHDGAELFLQVDNDAIDSDPGVTFTVGGSMPFNIGAIGHEIEADHSGARQFFNGDINRVMLFDVALTDQADRDLLWNNGEGVKCTCP